MQAQDLSQAPLVTGGIERATSTERSESDQVTYPYDLVKGFPQTLESGR
jgi:hypothetical protein